MNDLIFLLLLDRYVHTAAVVVTSNVANIPILKYYDYGIFIIEPEIWLTSRTLGVADCFNGTKVINIFGFINNSSFF